MQTYQRMFVRALSGKVSSQIHIAESLGRIGHMMFQFLPPARIHYVMTQPAVLHGNERAIPDGLRFMLRIKLNKLYNSVLAEAMHTRQPR